MIYYVQEELCKDGTQSRLFLGKDIDLTSDNHRLPKIMGENNIFMVVIYDENESCTKYVKYRKKDKSFRLMGRIFKLKGRKRQILKLIMYKKRKFVDFGWEDER